MSVVRSVVALSSVAVIVVAAGMTRTTSAQTGKTVDAATAGMVTGRAVFEGAPPPPEALKGVNDPACQKAMGDAPTNDTVVIGANGALKNVFVYVKSGLDPAYSFAVPSTPVQLDQRGCLYVPKVVGVRVGQPLDVLNSDTTVHNVHAVPFDNDEFNKGEMGGTKITQTFTKPETMVKIKCDVHPWMASYVGVMTHPFFAVSAADGSFSLRSLPPGTYTLAAWHEKFGTKTAQVTIGPKQNQAVTFTFTAQK
jgi:plastocyanin